MKSPQDLHTIIKSLTKSEKRLFKLHVSGSQKSENNYTILFDAIDAQEVYNEQKLQQKLFKHNFSKQISRTKFLLYEQIMKVLQQFFSARSEYAKLDVLLHSIDVLFHKTLYTQAYKILNRGKKIAIANHLTSWQQKFLEKEKQLLPFLENHKTIQNATIQLLESYDEVAQKLHTENLYRSLHTKVRLHYDTFFNFHKTTQINNLLTEIMNDSLMKDESRASTFFSKVLFMEISFINAYVSSNFYEASYWGNRMLICWQEDPKMKSVFKIDFIRQLRDYTFYKVSYDIINHDLVKVLEEWNAVKANALSKNEVQKYQFEINAVEFLFHLTTNNHSELETSYLKVQTNLTCVNLLPIHQRIIIFYHISIYHFLEKQYKKAQSIIKKIDTLGSSQLDPHIMKYVRLMDLILQYELEDQEVNYNDIRAIRAQLKSIGAIGKIEDTLLEVMKGLIDTPEIKLSSERDKTFNKLLETNKSALKQHPISISHQILKIWINGKISAERKYA